MRADATPHDLTGRRRRHRGSRPLLMLAIIWLSACSDATQPAKDAVMQRLKDPGSVQWRGVVYDPGVDSWGKPHPKTCGWYNAKNGFGGYEGFKPFVYVESNLFLNADAETLMSQCHK